MLAEHPCRSAVLFLQETDQQMFDSDLIAAHPLRFLSGERKDALGFIRKPHI
jgi:hypothetical protein